MNSKSVQYAKTAGLIYAAGYLITTTGLAVTYAWNNRNASNSFCNNLPVGLMFGSALGIFWPCAIYDLGSSVINNICKK